MRDYTEKKYFRAGFSAGIIWSCASISKKEGRVGSAELKFVRNMSALVLHYLIFLLLLLSLSLLSLVSCETMNTRTIFPSRTLLSFLSSLMSST